MSKTRVLIIDDSELIRNILCSILSSAPDIEVVGTANDPIEARTKIKELTPDLITLDIEMPKMDGISFLQKIMSLRPMPVIMVSTLTQKGADITIQALEMGAIDFVGKPQNISDKTSLAEFREELVQKIQNAMKAKIYFPKYIASSSPKVIPLPKQFSNKIIVIGASTGGVEALKVIISALPPRCPPILIVQHMPESFTTSFAKRLNLVSKVTVHEASDCQEIKDNNVYIAPGSHHMEIKAKGSRYCCKLKNSARVSGHRPSVDVLFSSCADILRNKAIGVILTGMGTDGAQGLLEMRRNGACTIGQNEASCVVYGMPKAARMADAVMIETSLENIAAEMLAKCT
jgi:two-component system chemotaxis response regulator CheB